RQDMPPARAPGAALARWARRSRGAAWPWSRPVRARVVRCRPGPRWWWNPGRAGRREAAVVLPSSCDLPVMRPMALPRGVCATRLSRASGADPRRGPAPHQSTHDAGMPQRVAARLRPYRQAVRLHAHLDLAHLAGDGVDGVDHVVEAAGQPQRLAVGADVAHVRAAAAGDRPVGDDLAGGEVDHRHAALAVARPVDLVRAAVGDVELAAVAARVQAV